MKSSFINLEGAPAILISLNLRTTSGASDKVYVDLESYYETYMYSSMKQSFKTYNYSLHTLSMKYYLLLFFGSGVVTIIKSVWMLLL